MRAVLLGERGLLSNLDDVDLNAVQIACDRVNSLTSEGQRVFEYQVNLEHLGIENTPDGNRIDVLGFDGAVRFVVVDLKFGRGWVTAPERNVQLLAYASGVHKAFGAWPQLAIVQPAAPEDLLVVTLTDEQFEAAEKRIAGIVKAAAAPDAPCIRGEHCRKMYCSGMGTCPMWRDAALVLLPNNVSVSEYMKASLPEIRSRLYTELKALLSWGHKVHAEIDAAILSSELEVPGYGIGASRSIRVWADEAVALTVLREIAVDKGVDPNLVETPACAVSPAEAEKIIGKAKAVKEKMESLIVKRAGYPKVVEVSPC